MNRAHKGAFPYPIGAEYDYACAGEKILLAHGDTVLYARIQWQDANGYYWRTDHKRARSRWNGHERVEDEGTRWLSGWWHSKVRIQALIAGAAL